MHRSKALIADVGGGSALLAILQQGEILSSGSYQLGSIRLQEVLSTAKETPSLAAELLRHQIGNVLAAIKSSLPLRQVRTFIAVGGDVRFAAGQIGTPAKAAGLTAIDSRQFDIFVARCENHSAEELARMYQIPFADAETLVPALLAYQALLHQTLANTILVPNVSMRDGILLDMARILRGEEDAELYSSVIQSARAIGEKYKVLPEHAFHVADLAVKLFDQLQRDHGLTARHRLLLRVSAILHEVGGFVSSRAHHKHSYYLIVNSEIFGLRREESQVVALVARYHRRGVPEPAHQEYMTLPRESRVIVSKLAALLRVADALDRGHAQQIRDIEFERRPDEFIIYVRGVPDLAMERRALASKADLFEDIYGMKVRLEEAQQTDAAATPPAGV